MFFSVIVTFPFHAILPLNARQCWLVISFQFSLPLHACLTHQLAFCLNQIEIKVSNFLLLLLRSWYVSKIFSQINSNFEMLTKCVWFFFILSFHLSVSMFANWAIHFHFENSFHLVFKYWFEYSSVNVFVYAVAVFILDSHGILKVWCA